MMTKLVDLLLLSCRCVVAVGWSAVCDCGYFLIILTYFLLQNYKISVVRRNPSKLFLLVTYVLIIVLIPVGILMFCLNFAVVFK